ncbi:MAG: DUF3274 domain-containing protein [Pseudomonadota bacterium]
MKYKRTPIVYGKGTGILHYNRAYDKTVAVRQNLPGNIIMIHGVNDVGTSYDQVEQGLCAGLRARMGWDHYLAGSYRMPGDQKNDKDTVQADPDAVFYKRQNTKETDSPVIPFYWGFAETAKQAGAKNGQRIDRYGNRLDKDLSKGGGPFANATSTLPDMWHMGKSQAGGLLDWAQKDATHPVLNNPGRMYMILAAKRLAALITMIRDYDENEAVTLVAHSQGCMLSLLAQAFLLQDGYRPADTLILNNPPYSLVDEMPTTTSWVEGSSGVDAPMQGHYDKLDGRQTMHARLQTLVNIVQGVVKARHSAPAFGSLTDQAIHHGMVSGTWQAAADRDNRGKVYLYFCPEDMTVALNNVQGIGWQGVPDYQRGSQLKHVAETTGNRAQVPTGRMIDVKVHVARAPMKELGAGFFQRVFTVKKRPDPKSGKPVLIGQARPHDFVLRTDGEDDQAHTEASDSFTSKNLVRARLPEPLHGGRNGPLTPEQLRNNIRTINGEPLPKPVEASLYAGARADAKGRKGALEDVDQIDAAIAVTSDYGGKKGGSGVWQVYQDPTGQPAPGGIQGLQHAVMAAGVYDGVVKFAPEKKAALHSLLNKGKSEGEFCQIHAVYDCMGTSGRAGYTGQVLVHRTETSNEARLRWQQASGARSFHGAIYGSADNHRQVTAYDVAIGGGKACTDPDFYKYLSAVADWRLKQGNAEKARSSILEWEKFVQRFHIYWKDEPQWRRELIEGNSKYYSTGVLPACVPALHVGLPGSVVCETLNGRRSASAKPTSPHEPLAVAITGKEGGV